MSGNPGSVQFVPTTAGSYRLQFMASDGLLQSTAEIQVQVSPAVNWRIQPLGASIVNGYGGYQSLRYPLWRKLIDAQVTFDMVGTRQDMDFVPSPNWPDYLGHSFDRDHQGQSGYTTAQIATALPGWMSSYTPDVSMIHAGTNNILQQGAAGVQSALDGLTAMVQALRLKNPNVRIYVSQLIPVAAFYSATAQTHIDTLNGGLGAWAAGLSTTQSPVKIVSVPATFSAAADTHDGLHPNAQGEEKLAQAFYDAMIGDL
jgi:lysophospholipase L1-like esterase